MKAAVPILGRIWENSGKRSGRSGGDSSPCDAIVSCLLMGCMVSRHAALLPCTREGLGNIETLVTDRNYGLALYVGFAGTSLFMGVIWCLWILSRKGAEEGSVLRSMTQGRGLIPFLLCAAMAFSAGPALTVIPPVDSVVVEWQGIAAGEGPR